MQSSLPIKILLAEPDPGKRRFLADLLARGTECWIVGESDNAADLQGRAGSLRPNVVVVSVDLFEQHDSPDLIADLSQLSGVEVIVISSWNDHRDVEAALKKGALGYLLEMDAGTELLAAVREVTAGEVYISSGVVGLWQGAAGA
ncbi:MAG: hypothetical protein QNJ40_18520 [Xanthomonadales bacterium]|nr:hypothetical protein [Xanthomonadales bacterium]